jgi:predicted methyltransferase
MQGSTGLGDAAKTYAELRRVLKPGGLPVMLS